jgi:hypothetical protein
MRRSLGKWTGGHALSVGTVVLLVFALAAVVAAAASSGPGGGHHRKQRSAKARGDSVTVVEDGPASPLNVVGNDRNVGPGPRRIRSVSQGVRGEVRIVGRGASLTYAPNPNFCGRDSFTYTLRRGPTATVSVTVTCVDDPPVAAGDSVAVAEGAPPTALDVLVNDDDLDGGPRSIESVSQGAHGAVAITGGGSGLTYQPTVAHYCGPDTFTYMLNGGSTATVSVDVTCVDDPPLAVADTRTVGEDDPATAIDVLANDTDSDGGPRSIESVTQGAHGSVALTGGGTALTYRPAADYCGPDSFTYTANGGSVGTVSVTVTCVDDPPVAVADSKTITEDDPATAIDVLANDTDIDAGPRSIVSVTQGAHGAVAVGAGGAGLTYKPAANYCGQDSFTYRLTPGGSTGTVTVTVTCVDDPPMAVEDTKTITEDDPATSIDVLANDPDIDGSSVKKVESVTQAAHGTVAITGGGSAVTYEPAPNFCGADTFEYTLNPGGSKATVSVNVNCVDDPPVAVDDSVSFTEDDSPTALAVLANDTDIDAGLRAVESVTQGTHGTVAIVNQGGELTYRPEPGYCGPDSFTYTENGGSSATVTVAVACLEQTTGIVELSTSPSLVPLAFDRTVDDYVLRCNNNKPVEVTAFVAPGYTVKVAGQAPLTGAVQTTVPLKEDLEFIVTVSRGDGEHRYHVRCLPSDFPAWEYVRFDPPSHRFYVVAPTLGVNAAKLVIIFDDHGVPVWWYEASESPFDAKVFPDGTIGWTQGTVPLVSAEIHELDGDLVRSFHAVPQADMDWHDLQELPNGDFLVLSYPIRDHVDLTPYGGGEDDEVFDGEVQEIDPAGNVVWSWDSKDHIGLAETGRWYSNAQSHGPGDVRDIVHINAVEPDGPDAFLISLRHTDAVYKIDKATGNVIWKLGGTTIPKSLTVLDDPYGSYPLGGQHDPRVLPDGTVTIHDNGTAIGGRAPRAVRYQIDEQAMTATLLEEVTDPEAPSSFCCGSARRSADGSWLMSWGGRSLVTEFNAEGNRTFSLGFGGPVSYRATSAPDGLLDIDQLRADMNSMSGG